MFVMITGEEPFQADSCEELLHSVRNIQLELAMGAWGHVSAAAKNLLAGLVCVDADRRLSASEALAHPWFADGRSATPTTPLASPLCQRLAPSLAPPQLDIDPCNKRRYSCVDTDSADADSTAVTAADGKANPATDGLNKRRRLDQLCGSHGKAVIDHHRFVLAPAQQHNLKQSSN